MYLASKVELGHCLAAGAAAAGAAAAGAEHLPGFVQPVGDGIQGAEAAGAAGADAAGAGAAAADAEHLPGLYLASKVLVQDQMPSPARVKTTVFPLNLGALPSLVVHVMESLPDNATVQYDVLAPIPI